MSSVMEMVTRRVEQKKADFTRYNFNAPQSHALHTFFDLAQEFDGFDPFYALCVAIPKVFFDLDCRMYAPGMEKEGNPLLVETTLDEELYSEPPDYLKASLVPYPGRDSMVFPIRGKGVTLMGPSDPKDRDNLLGLFEILLGSKSLSQEDILFFEKYTNRMGFSMHNRFLSEKNLDHLRFIRSLVADIEHNVIVPNMVYKLYLRNFKGLVAKNRQIEEMLAQYLSWPGADPKLRAVHLELSDINRALNLEFRNLEGHYQTTTLFLETLFRRSHFDNGRLTVRKKVCNMNKDVVQPQLERYMDRFHSADIVVDDRFSHIPEEEVISVVDIGLMAQVYANLFTNAIKYTHEVWDDDGRLVKRVSYGRELLRDFFGPGRDGIKYNVFSTGTHIAEASRAHLYEDGFRAENSEGKPGDGHGLSFVRNVVELHDGVVGYEPTAKGNNFYFILPR